MKYRPLALSATAAASVLLLSACSSGTTAATPPSPAAHSPKSTTAAAPLDEEIGTMAQGGTCTYDEKGKPWVLSHHGKGGKNDGQTKKDGRVLILSTGTAKTPDNSAARLSGKVKKGDRVWVDISHDKGKNWRGCGGVTTKKDKDKFYSKWYAHSGKNIKNRVMRACARTTTDGKRTTWCGPWWSDTP
ncbi:hypothetical protein [Streptomyces sp. TRM64462]|uniref:hypothetical protein n=1 Tax=Streptomyces sp. TRM64462 TaxID=2741726 RepID=UPI00158604B5|nr:hypothetical protein [Streptomyces sp. TRM64462]